MMHTGFATLATEAESDDAIDQGEADARGDQADRRPATEQPPTAS